MDRHWSGVAIGEYFALTIEYNPAVYSQSSVSVPFHRSQPHGLSCCMLETVALTAKSAASDSAYHLTRALKATVAPTLLGAPERKRLHSTPLTSFFSAVPKPAPAAAAEMPASVEEPPITPSFRRISLTSTSADDIGEIGGGAAEWNELAGVWTIRSDHSALSEFAAFMTPGQRLRYGVEHDDTPEVEEVMPPQPPSQASSAPRVPGTHRPSFNLKCCVGVDACTLLGVEMHTLFLHYPTQLHSGPMLLRWHPPSSDGALHSRDCAVTLALDGPDACKSCESLLEEPSLQRLVLRSQDTQDSLLHRSTTCNIFLSFLQMQDRQRHHARLSDLFRLRVSISSKRVAKLLRGADDVKQMMQLLSRNDVPRLRVLLGDMVRKGRSIKSIVVKVNKAIDGTYTSHGGTMMQTQTKLNSHSCLVVLAFSLACISALVSLRSRRFVALSSLLGSSCLGTPTCTQAPSIAIFRILPCPIHPPLPGSTTSWLMTWPSRRDGALVRLRISCLAMVGSPTLLAFN